MAVQPWEFMIKDTPARDWSEGMGSSNLYGVFLRGCRRWTLFDFVILQ